MQNSVIVGFIMTIWKMLVCWYDNSGVAKIINSICGFFTKRADGSFFVRTFLHGFCTGAWWKNSLSCRTLSLLLSGRKTRREFKSRLIDAILDIYNIPLRYIGITLLSVTVGMTAATAVSRNLSGILHIAIIVTLAVLTLVCLLLSKSAYSLYSGSFIAKFIGGFFADGIYKEPSDRKINLAVTCPIAAVIGIAAGISNPILPLFAAIAILFAAAVLARYEIGVFMIIFLAAFMPTALIAGLCILSLGGFLLALWSGRIKVANLSVFAPLLAMYVIFGVFSTLTSFHFANSAFIFCIYLIFIGAYILIVHTLTDYRRWRAATVLFAVGVLFIALLGILQNFTMDPTTQSWVDSNMFEDIKTRVYSTFENPNVLGQYLIVTIPIIFSLFWYEKKFGQKTIWLGIFAVCFLCLIYTWSRGAWVGVMLGIVCYLLLKDKRWLILCILGVLVMPFILPDSIMNRLLSIGNTGDSSTAYRVSVWIASARMAMDFWMSGVGFGSDAFAAVYSSYALNGAGFALHSHNFYIQLVTDMGIGGLITYLLMVATAYREIALVKNRKTMIGNVTLATAGVLAGYLFQGIAESLWYNLRMSLIFWIMIALIVSGSKIDRRGTK